MSEPKNPAESAPDAPRGREQPEAQQQGGPHRDDDLSSDDFDLEDLPGPAPRRRARRTEWIEPQHIAQPPVQRQQPAAEEDSTQRQPTMRVSSSTERHDFPLFDDIAGRSAEVDYVNELGRGTKADRAERPRWRPPLLVWAFTALFVALMWMCTFLYPAFSGYDEAFHVDMTYSYYNGNGFYDPGDRLMSLGVDRAHSNLQVPPRKPVSQQQERARGDRESFDAYGGDVGGTYPVPNQMVQHPPLYYAIGAGILRLFPNSGDWPYDQWVAVLRYLSILMVAPLPILAWATTKCLVGNGPAAVAAAAIPLTIPNLARMGGSVNNDDLLILLTGLVVWLLAKVLAGDLRRRTAVVIGILTGLACLTKGFALALPIVVILAYGLAMLRHRRRAWLAVLFALAAAVVIGAWWWVRNLVLFHTIQPDGLGKVWSVRYFGKARPGFDRVDFVRNFFPLLARRTWGGIGLPEVPQFAPVICYAWAAVAVLGMVLGIGFGVRGRGGRLSAVVLLLPTLAYLAIMMKGSADHYLHNGILTGVQGRYLYPTVVGVAALLGIGYTRVLGRTLSGWLPFLAVLGAVATQVLAWRSLVHVWWVPRNITGDRPKEVQEAFRGILRWSPWNHAVTSIPFGAVIVLAVAAAIGAIAYGARGHGADEPVVTDDTGRHDLEPLPH